MSTEVHYPDNFITQADAKIRLYRQSDLQQVNSGNTDVRARHTLSFADVLEGPKMSLKQTTFNGHDATFGLDGDTPGKEYYEIPFGNRVILVDVEQSLLSGSEKTIADKVLKSITLTQTTDNIEPAHVENCRK